MFCESNQLVLAGKLRDDLGADYGLTVAFSIFTKKLWLLRSKSILKLIQIFFRGRGKIKVSSTIARLTQTAPLIRH